jgi:hypothetical protein
MFGTAPSSSANTYPSHQAPFEVKKSAAWCRQWAKAFFHDKNNSPLFFNRAEQYAINRAYAIGQQDIKPYQRMMEIDDQSEAWVNLNWKMPDDYPKFRSIILEKLEQILYKPIATAIDPTALNEKRSHRNELIARVKLAPLIAEQSAEAGVPAPEPELQSPFGAGTVPMPRTVEEVEMYMNLDYKHRLEIYMEQGLDLVLYENDWKEVRKEVLKDLIDCGASSLRDYIDSNGYIRVAYEDPATIIAGPFKRQDGKDLRRIGVFKEMSLAELRVLAGSQFTEKEYEQIATTRSGRSYGTVPLSSSALSQPYDSETVKVFTCEWASSDLLTTEQKENQYGNTHKYLKPFGYQEPKTSKYKRTVARKEVKTWYTCSWVVGTDFVFDYGLAHNQKRPKDNLADSISSFHIYCPRMAGRENKAIGESVISHIDEICVTKMKLSHLVASARPAGLSIDVGTLVDVMDGKGGEAMTPMELMTLLTQKGIMLYRRTDDAGDYKNGSPIQELAGGFANDIIRCMEIINFHKDGIRSATGLNEITDASSPAPGQLVGTGQLANAATNSALGHLVSADRTLFENLIKSLALRFQDVAANYADREWMVEALGDGAVQTIRANADVSMGTLGIRLEALPTEQDQAWMEQQIAQAQEVRTRTGTGGIEVEDAFAVRRLLKTSVKKAEQLLIFKRQQRRELDLQQAQQQSQINAQTQQQSAQQTAELAEQSAQAAHEREKELLLLRAQLEEQADERKHQFTIQELNLQGAIKEDSIRTKGEEDQKLKVVEAEVYEKKGDMMYRNLQENKAGLDTPIKVVPA